MRLFLTLLLLAPQARADDDIRPCTKLSGLNVEKKVGEYCENYTPFNRTAEVMKAQQGCVKFYTTMIHVVQHLCSYLDETDRFIANDTTLLAELDKGRSQSAALDAASVTNARARALSRKWALKTSTDLHFLDTSYADYVNSGITPMMRTGLDIAREETLGSACGRQNSPVSVNILGLGGLSLDEAKKAYEQIGPSVSTLSNRLMHNSNNFKNTADQLMGLVQRASDITGAGLPEIPAPSGANASVVAENASSTNSAQKSEEYIVDKTAGMLKLSSGKLIAKPSTGIKGGIGLLVDVGLRWIEHHKLDSTSQVFIGARIIVAGAGAMSFLGTGPAAPFVTTAIETGLTWLEGVVRGIDEAEFQARLRTYLPYAEKVVQPASLSTDVSKAWHAAFRVEFTDVNPATGQLRTRPTGAVTESCR